MKGVKKLIFPLVIILYALLYMATKKDLPCNTYCQQLFRLDTMLTNSRPYVWNIGSCVSGKPPNDTLCVQVDNSANVNWNLLADTICQYATQVGLPGQRILIMKIGSPPDTLANKQCP